MKLHNVAGSPNGRNVEAVIHRLGLDVEIQLHNLFNGDLARADYRAINPNAKVPALVDGDLCLWESTAIMQYLADKAGDDSLFPRDARGRAEVTRWQCWETAHFNRAFGTLAFETVAKPRSGAGEPDARDVEAACRELARFAPVLDGHLKGRHYLVGDRLTLADYAVVALEPYQKLVPFDFSPFQHIDAYFERMRQDASWRATAKTPRPQSVAA
jgi:glutathione S-transferase